MCGISGYISRKRITEEELRIMNDTMIHRGPNDNGVMIYPGTSGYSIGLAQRRLAILDLSPLGHQPMESNDGRISLVFISKEQTPQERPTPNPHVRNFIFLLSFRLPYLSHITRGMAGAEGLPKRSRHKGILEMSTFNFLQSICVMNLFA